MRCGAFPSPALLGVYHQVDDPPRNVDASLDGCSVQETLDRLDLAGCFYRFGLGGPSLQLDGCARAAVDVDGYCFRLERQQHRIRRLPCLLMNRVRPPDTLPHLLEDM